VSGPLFAHALDARVLGWWSWNPLVSIPLAISTLLYGRGVEELRDHGHPVRWWKPIAFGAGVLTVVIALLSPLDALSDLLFSAHMTQHELLMIVAPPLLVSARPLVPMLFGMPPRWRARVIAIVKRDAVDRAWRALTHPFVALVLHGVVLWIWHAPMFFEGAMRHPAIHAVQHASFFFTAGFFWWGLVHGRYGRAGYGLAVLYVFATSLHSSVLGALLTIGAKLWYPIYRDRGVSIGIDPLADQTLAGLLMWIPAGALLVVVALALFAAWLGEAERRMQRHRLFAPASRLDAAAIARTEDA